MPEPTLMPPRKTGWNLWGGGLVGWKPRVRGWEGWRNGVRRTQLQRRTASAAAALCVGASWRSSCRERLHRGQSLVFTSLDQVLACPARTVMGVDAGGPAGFRRCTYCSRGSHQSCRPCWAGWGLFLAVGSSQISRVGSVRPACNVDGLAGLWVDSSSVWSVGQYVSIATCVQAV